MKKALLAAAVIALAGLLVWVAGFWEPDGAHRPVTLAEAPKGGDFTLHSAGGPVSLKDLHGKVVVLYFGYTFCPDICPTSLGFTSQALSALEPAELAQVQTLLVTLDPERDTLDKLKSYTAYFHPNIVGLTGTPEEIAAVAKLYDVSYAKQETGSAGGYVVDHSAYTYIIAPDGTLFTTLGHGTPPAKVLEAIRAAMKQKR